MYFRINPAQTTEEKPARGSKQTEPEKDALNLENYQEGEKLPPELLADSERLGSHGKKQVEFGGTLTKEQLDSSVGGACFGTDEYIGGQQDVWSGAGFPSAWPGGGGSDYDVYENMMARSANVHGAEESEKSNSSRKTGASKPLYSAAEPGTLDRVEAGETTLARGASGPEVKEAQELMLRHGADFKKYGADGKVLKDYGADGLQGPVTTREVRKLQKQWGLEQTGEINQATLERLRSEPSKKEQRTTELPPEYSVPAKMQEELDEVRAKLARTTNGRERLNLERKEKKLVAESSPEGLAAHYEMMSEDLTYLKARLESSDTGATSNRLRQRRRNLEARMEEMRFRSEPRVET